MQTIAVLSRKGGAGKTTVAVNLGLAAMQSGLRVVVADVDPQRSAAEVLRDRPEASSLLIETAAGKLPALQDACIRHSCDLLIIDTAPAPEADVAQAMLAADLCLAVARPTRLDLAAVKQTIELLRRHRTRALVVLNQCPPAQGDAEIDLVEQAIETLRQGGIPLAETLLRAHTAYQRAFTANQSVTEWQPDSEAAADVLRLLTEVRERLDAVEVGDERLAKLRAQVKRKAQIGARPSPLSPVHLIQSLIRRTPGLERAA